MRFILIIILFLVIQNTCYCQIQEIDSINALLIANKTDDSIRVDLLIKLSDLIKSSDPDSAIALAESAQEISIQINFKNGEAWALNRISGAYWMKANYPEALKLSFEALEMFEKIGNLKGIGQSYNSIANTYNMEGENRKSLNYYAKSIKIYEQLDDLYNVNRATANIGRTYFMLDEYANAMEYLDLVIKAYESDKYNILYAIVINTKGDVLQKLNKHDEALEHYLEALKISEKLQIPRIITYSTRGISEIYQIQKKLNLSNAYAKRTLEISNEIGYLENAKNAALLLSDNNKTENNYLKAYDYFVAHTAAKDSMFNLEKEKALKKLSKNFEIAQKQKEIELLKTKQHLQVQTNKNQQLLLYLLISIIVFVIAFLALYIRNDKKRQKANDKLEKQSKMLTEANVLKDKLFSIISHDLRGPFNSLLLLFENFHFLDLKKKEFDAAKDNLYLHTKSMSDMINNLLIWSQMRISGVENTKKSFNISDTFSSILTVYQITAKEKNIDLTTNTESEVFVLADEDLLKCVLRNLVNNAIKFTNENGTINFNIVDKNDSNITVVVADNGVGMNEELVTKILQEDSIKTTLGTNKERGSGLGLLLIKDIIKSNGGKYWIESKPSKGTKFFFTIPKGIS